MKGMLSCTKLFAVVKNCFARIKEQPIRKRSISLSDCMMSAYALFSLKYPSLLQFDKHVREDVTGNNIKNVYQINQVPSDTQMRERLDEIDPKQIRGAFKKLFAQCQRSKRLEIFKYYNDRRCKHSDSRLTQISSAAMAVSHDKINIS